MAILAGDHTQLSVKVRHSALGSENLTNLETVYKIEGKLVVINNRKSYYELSIGTQIGDLE